MSVFFSYKKRGWTLDIPAHTRAIEKHDNHRPTQEYQSNGLSAF